jgi:ribosome-binding factor A
METPEGNRNDKVAARLAQAAAQFFENESNRQSLITVTRAVISTDGADATVFISVLPERAEASVISFAKRNRTELRNYIRKELPMGRVPTLDVEIDVGEKHRQHIDELLR